MRLIELVRNVEGLKPSEKLVFLVMATYAREDGTNIFPGLELLTRKTGLCEKTVRTAIKGLLTGNYLTPEGKRGFMNAYNIPSKELWPDNYAMLGKKNPKKTKLVPADAPPAPNGHRPPPGPDLGPATPAPLTAEQIEARRRKLEEQRQQLAARHPPKENK